MLSYIIYIIYIIHIQLKGYYETHLRAKYNVNGMLAESHVELHRACTVHRIHVLLINTDHAGPPCGSSIIIGEEAPVLPPRGKYRRHSPVGVKLERAEFMPVN